jgi:Flp pilus assembly pilin Flp
MKYYSEKIASSKERRSTLWSPIERGQTMVEYALILVLVSVSFGIGLMMTQPAISAAFQNTIYGLLGQESEFRDDAHPAEFWLTVTWVAENPPEQRRIPTRTLAAPTATQITPEGQEGEEGEEGGGNNPGGEPQATITPRPSSTPVDIAHVAPWRDTVDNPNWYRLGSPAYLGSADWHGQYYRSSNFTGELIEYYNAPLYGRSAHGVLKFPSPAYQTWTNQDVNPLNSEDMSVIFTRTIRVAENNTPLQFHMEVGGRVRMWLIPNAITDDLASIPDLASCGSQCLQIFNNQTDGLKTLDPVLYMANQGYYRLHVEYINVGSTQTPKVLNLDILTIRNPDDRSLDAGGNPTGSTSQCNWGQRSTTDSNSLMHLWDQNPRAQGNPNANNNPNTVCYLELRGYVHVPDTIVRPQFVFWDVWDIGGQQQAWFEIGIYTPVDADSPNSLDRDAINWHRVDVHSANTTNYNWTRQVYDFEELQLLTGEDFRGQNVTFRFAFSNGSSGRQRWHIDDVQIIDGEVGTYGNDIGLDQLFALNDATEANYFRRTGQWELTSNNTAPAPTGGGSGCCSWELRPNGNYTTLSYLPNSPQPNSNPNTNIMRVHYLEVIPTIDVNLSLIDSDGDEGAPVISFWHGFHVGPYTSLQVEYRPEGTDEWLVIPSDGVLPPLGQLVPLTNTQIMNQRSMHPVSVSLEHIPSSVTRYNIRFAMYVHGLNTQQQEGWWIDNIRFHREDALRFLDYPFYDNAENGMGNWLSTGNWWVSNQQSYSGSHSFTDSPTGSYGTSTAGQYLTTIYPIDLLNNTPANLLEGGNVGGAAIAPYLTFWHKRELGSDTHLEIQWKPVTAPETEWQMLWKYVPRSSYNGYNVSSRTLINYAWEYARISLEPVLWSIGTPSDLRADDILIRFHLRSGGTPADGWYVDDIRIDEKPIPNSYNLWEVGQTPSIGSTTLPAGQGLIYTASSDDPDWQSKWLLGGDWQRISWESHNGQTSFHESPEGQSGPPIANEDIPETARTRRGTYNILELTDVIDMRGTPTTSLPTLYFWSRFYPSSADRLRVQISYEMPTTNISGHINHMQQRCPSTNSNGQTIGAATSCYEQEWGWSRWLDVPSNWNNCPGNATYCSTWGNNNDAKARNDGWRLWQVDVRSVYDTFNNTNVRLVQSGSNLGRRIRIRFVMDAQDNINQARNDGWYIGEVSIEPRRIETLATIADSPFADSAQNMFNWIAEGGWGIDPAIGTPIVLGVWRESWWEARHCNRDGFESCVNWVLNNFTTNPNYVPPISNSTSWNNRTFRMGPFNRNVTGIHYTQSNNRGLIPNNVYDLIRATDPSKSNVEENMVGRWVMDTPIVGTAGVEAGTYHFLVKTDDGARMRWAEIDAAGNIINSPPMPGRPNNPWNIMGSNSLQEPRDSWRGQGATLYVGHPVTLEAGKRYRLILEYYNGGGNGELIVNVTRSLDFSFGDTPRLSVDLSQPDVPPLNYANTSIISAGTFDLRGTTAPQLLYNITGAFCDSSFRPEVSADGGFSWNSLRNYHRNWEDDVLWYLDQEFGNWSTRQAILTPWRDEQILLRFRFDRSNRHISDCHNNIPGYDGVWITDIVIADGG